jgi:hypothetical protein
VRKVFRARFIDLLRRGGTLVLACALSARAGQLALVRPMVYTGAADSSGAVAVSSNLFVVCDDEDNTLRLYRSDRSGPPLKEFDLDAFLEVSGKSLEADLEAGARIRDRAYWIGSHGRNRNGKERANRCRLFATDIRVNGEEVTLRPAGKPYKRLLDDLLADARFAAFHLPEAAARAPKDADALNIEGLSATPDGYLLIGFRNPIPQGRALLIPLLNPNEVIEDKPARFGAAIQLDLGGLGIRDIALYQATYLVIAGSYHGGGHFRLYRWAGEGAAPEALTVKHLNDYHPEALIIYPRLGLREVQILSDDGTEEVDGVSQKALTDQRKKTFRSFWVRGLEP